MTNPDCVELWPETWKETRVKAQGIIDNLQTKVAKSPLTMDELGEVNRVISHLRGPWKRPWRNPIITKSTQVIRDHFSKAFLLEPAAKPLMQYRAILKETLPTGYFVGKPVDGPELTAIGELCTFHNALRRRPSAFSLSAFETWMVSSTT